MSEAITVISSLVAGGAGSAAVTFLARTIITERITRAIQHEYDQKLSSHQAKLEADSAVSLARLTSELQITATERSIRLETVFAEQAKVIIEVYGRLLRFSEAVHAYTSIIEWSNDPPKAERRKIAGEKLQDFLDYYRPRRPYLPKRTVTQIEDLKQRLNTTAIEFRHGVEEPIRRKPNPEEKDPWLAAHETMTQTVPPLLETLEDDFRTILGTNE